jgi:hypothetical protein
MGLLDILGADPSSPRGMQLQGLLGGLTQMGGTMAQAGQMRPVGTPGPGLGDAFNAFGTGRRAAITGAMQDNQMAATQRQMAAWQDAASGAPKTPEGVQLFNAIPARNRSAIFAMGPEAGFKALSSMLTQRPVAASPGQTLIGPDGAETRIPITPEDHAFKAAGRPVQSVNVTQGPQFGTIPSGEQLERMPDGSYRMSPIPGGPADRKLQAEQFTDETAMMTADQTAALIDSVLNDPSLGMGTGMSGLVLNRIPGTPMYDFSTKVKQLQGKAFLQAFESLKGGGQITEIEGKKATEAIARLDAAQSEESFREALKELRDITVVARNRIMSRYQPPPGRGGVPIPGSGQVANPPPNPPPPAGGAPTMRWNPATGKVEPVR